jgi:hypothetical protein
MFLDNGGTVPSVKITPGRDRVRESMALLDVPGVLDCPAERDVTPDQADVGTWSWGIGAAVRADKQPVRESAGTSWPAPVTHTEDFQGSNPAERPDSPANDKGWVHLNSNIHNKAVHNLLTTRATGRRCSPSRRSHPTCFGSALLAPMAISQPRCR